MWPVRPFPSAKWDGWTQIGVRRMAELSTGDTLCDSLFHHVKSSNMRPETSWAGGGTYLPTRTAIVRYRPAVPWSITVTGDDLRQVQYIIVGDRVSIGVLFDKSKRAAK